MVVKNQNTAVLRNVKTLCESLSCIDKIAKFNLFCLRITHLLSRKLITNIHATIRQRKDGSMSWNSRVGVL